MADNILKRIIQLVLDRTAAKKTQDDVKDTAETIDGTFKKLAGKIAQYLAVAFIIDKIVDFGRESVKQAAESEAAWSDLRVSIENAGDSFDGLEESLRATADAFQDATGKDDDLFATSLARLVSLTGDTSASINNMGLVANVASKFFKGELEPATQLVAKAMNGNTIALHKMGINAKDGQQALEILAQRSMGAATKEAGTFSGQLNALHEDWNDVLKDFGFAIIQSGGATNAITVLRSAIRTFGEWIVRNKDEIREWVTDGVVFAIDAADTLLRAILLISNTFQGVFLLALGVGAQAIAELEIGFVNTKEAAIAFLRLFGIDKSDELVGTDKIRRQAEALRDWGKAAQKAGEQAGEAAKKNLFQPMFSSDQFKAPPKTALPGENAKPMVGKNVETDSSKDVQKAIEEFQKAEKAADNMRRILGADFDGVGAEIDRSTKLLNVLAGNGIDPVTVGFGGLAEKLRTLVNETQPLAESTKNLAKVMGTDAAIAAVTMATGTELATTKLDLLKQQQSAVLAEMKKLADKHLEGSQQFKNYAEQYTQLSNAIGDETKIQAAIDANKELAKSLQLDLAVGVLTGGSALDQLKMQQAAALEGFTNLVKSGVDPASEAAQKFARDYIEATTALHEAADIQDSAEAFRELGDSIRASLFEESIGAISKLDELTQKQKTLEKAMATKAIRQDAEALKQLRKQYQEVTEAIKQQTIAMQLQAATADFLAEALGAALQGGLGKAAAQKAKQNAIEAAEMLVRAGVFALFGDFPHAGASLALAGQFAAVALAWGGLAAASGGGGGGSSPVSSSSSSLGSANSGGQDITQSRTATARSTSSSTSPSAEVSIYLVGPGFNAVNPEVQKIVRGAAQEAAERYGPNSRVRIRTSSESNS